MTPEHIKSNIASWETTLAFINSFADDQYPSPEWCALARKFMEQGIERGFNRHFRAGTSMYALLLSTLDRYGLNYEPRVEVSLQPPETVWMIYSPAFPAAQGDAKLEYHLEYLEVMPTFQRFLNHLWVMTQAEPLPSDMRSPDHNFDALIMSEDDKKDTHWMQRR